MEDYSFDQDKVRTLEASIEKFLYQEEAHWKQRSRNNWLTSRDRNSAFFHRSNFERWKCNRITHLKNWDDRLLSDQKDIEIIITVFYSNLFTSQNPSDQDIEQITDHLAPSVTQEMNDDLTGPFSKEKICKSLLNLNPSKALGSDSFTTLSFKIFGTL